jgi:hypothetical protein
VTFGRPLPLPARDFKKLRPVPANSKVGIPGPARGQQRTAHATGITTRKIRLFCRNKVELQIFIENIYRFWGFISI